MFTVLACIRDDHDLRLVVLAAIICVLACVTALRFQRRVEVEEGRSRLWLLALTGTIAGAGVWSTHFVAMLAYEASLVIQYDFLITIASLVVAVAGMVGGFALAATGSHTAWKVAGGAAVGLSIVALHFIGISAMRSSFFITWDWAFVAASVGLSVAGGATALVILDRSSGVWGWILPPLALVVGIVGLHFTAMAAITLTPDVTAPTMSELVDRSGLAIMVGGTALLIILGSALMAMMETRLRHAAMKDLEIAFQGVPTGLAMFDPAGRLAIWNAAYEQMMAPYGIRPAVGMTRRGMILHAAHRGDIKPDTEDLDQWAIDQEMARRSSQAQEWPTPSGGWIRAETSQLANGGTISVVTDISAEKAVAIAMQDARDRAEAANRAKSDFLANMSHEIRTPLNGILGMAQVMAGDTLSAPQAKRLKVIRESGGTLLEILNDILDLAKVQAGKMELERTEVDVNALLRGLGAAFEGAAAERDIELAVETSEDLAGMWSLDALRTRQVLANLVGNAIKFTHEGSVTLTAARHASGVRFTVVDTGIGIHADRMDALFEKFVQADGSTTRRYGGTGLGLAICQELVTLMQGDISVVSTPGEGSCFTVDLPSLQTASTAPMAAPVTPGVAPEARNVRILAAEDNPTNQLVLRSILNSLGCDADIVSNGLEAVEASGTGDYDLILMDIQMPEMNGLDAASAIRAREAAGLTNRVPILALTANVMSHQVESYLALGMDDCVAKPIQIEDLYRAMNSALGPQAQAA